MTHRAPALPVRSALRIAVALVAAGFVLLRLAAVLHNPQFWAEDGAVFFAGAAVDPGHGIGVVFQSYAGYLHLIPRLIASAGSFLPVAAQPGFYAYAAVVVLAVVAWGIQSPRIALPGASVAALALGTIPHTGEVYGTICNIQWVTALLLFGILIAADGRSSWERGLDRAGLLVTGLTGPFVVLATPLFAYRAWHRKTRESWILAAVAGACTLAQLPSLLFHPAESAEGPVPAWSFGHLLAVLGRRLVVSLFAGRAAVPSALSILALFVGLGLLAYALWRRRQAVPGAGMLASAAVLVILASIVKVRMDQMPYNDLLDGDRYLFVGKVVLVWLLIALAVSSSRGIRVAVGLLLAAALVFNAQTFRFAPMPDMDWPTYAKAIERGEGVRAPILPKGFYLWVPPHRASKPEFAPLNP